MTSRPWNQHTSSAQDLQIAKRLVTEDILERHSAGPHATHIPQAASLSGASSMGGKGMLTEPAEFVPGEMERATFAEEQRQQRMQTKGVEQGTRTKARHGLVAEPDMTQSTRWDLFRVPDKTLGPKPLPAQPTGGARSRD